MTNEIIKNIVKEAEVTAKKTALDVLKTLDTEQITALIDAELTHIIAPLEVEIATTASWWVKIRNRMYITVLKNSVGAIVKAVQDKIATL